MAKPAIEGKWIGHFSYGETYPKDYRNKQVSFTVEIIKIDDIIRGTCVDDLSKDLFSTPATIEGSFENDFIYFTKQYPSLLTIDENNNLIAIPNKPSLSILYKGVLSKKLFSNTYFFKGNWEISGSYLDDKGNANYYTLDGDWRMKKDE